MTDIREGLARRLPMSGTGNPDWVMAALLIEYLRSEGVVRKVEGELPLFSFPSTGYHPQDAEIYRQAQQDMINKGYTLTTEEIDATETPPNAPQ